MNNINPLRWNRNRQAALVFAAIFGATLSVIFATNIFDPEKPFYLLILTMWGGMGALVAVTVDFVFQVAGSRK